MRTVTAAIHLSVLVASSWLAPPAGAACLSDVWGQVTCGVGPCAADRYGRVYCAQYRFGSVVTTISGQVVCGRGQCVTTLRGDVICSNMDGGGVALLVDGKVRCAGQCETASPDFCEQTPAGGLEGP